MRELEPWLGVCALMFELSLSLGEGVYALMFEFGCVVIRVYVPSFLS